MTSFSKTHGAYVETAHASVSKAGDKGKSATKILKTADVEMNTSAQVISDTELQDRMHSAKKTLKSLAAAYPKGSTFIGWELQGARKLKATLCRVEGSQLPLPNDGFEQQVILEQAAATGAIKRLMPMVRRVREGKATTEEVVEAARKEPNPSHALGIMKALADTQTPLIIDGTEVIEGRKSREKLKSPNSKRPYSLELSVLSVNGDTGEVICRLMGGEKIGAVFDTSDVEKVIMSFQTSGEPLILLGECGLLGVHVKARCTVALLLRSNGRKGFECGFVGLEDRAELIAQLQKAGKKKCPDLFG